MKSFLYHERPLITPMLSSTTEDGLREEIERSSAQGADAFCLMLENLPEELRTREKMTKIIAFAKEKPVYVSCYERNDRVDETDDDRANCLLLALECGATIADVRGDMFCTTPGELTEDPVAVDKQRKLIEAIHSMGKEAIMSSHLIFRDVFQFISTDKALEMALAHKSRGADISKIVTAAETEDELSACFETITALKKAVGIPTVFLCSGKYALRHRTACGLIYEPIVFVKEKQFAEKNSPQLSIETMVRVFKTAGILQEDEYESSYDKC